MDLTPETKVGFLGAGKLVQAIASGLIDVRIVKPENMMASARTELGLEEVKKSGLTGTLDNKKVVSECSVVFLAVAPKVVPGVLKEVGDGLSLEKLLISVVCSTTSSQIVDMIGKNVPVIRAIPNTPVAVREGVIRAYPGEFCSPDQVELCRLLMGPLGLFSILPNEELINATSGLCGCSPAFVYMMIDAMANAAVRMGLPREQAVKLAAQTVAGSAGMVLESDKHVAELVNDVCTPGGVTIEGVWHLEKKRFKGTVMDAVIRSTEKSLEKVASHNTPKKSEDVKEEVLAVEEAPVEELSAENLKPEEEEVKVDETGASENVEDPVTADDFDIQEQLLKEKAKSESHIDPPERKSDLLEDDDTNPGYATINYGDLVLGRGGELDKMTSSSSSDSEEKSSEKEKKKKRQNKKEKMKDSLEVNKVPIGDPERKSPRVARRNADERLERSEYCKSCRRPWRY